MLLGRRGALFFTGKRNISALLNAEKGNIRALLECRKSVT